MTATEIVARWQHLDAALSDPTWTPDIPAYHMLREFWQAAKLGAQAEAEIAELRARLDWAEDAPNRRPSAT